MWEHNHMKFRQFFFHLIARFNSANNGTSAVEFALVFPILLIVYFGLVEISSGLEAKRKVENTANLTGMLVAQATTVNDAYMNNVFEASQMAFEPLDATPLRVVVSSVVRVFEDDNWVNKVEWSESYGSGASARAVDSVFDPPQNILGDNRGIIVTEVEYTYARILTTNTFSSYFPNTITFSKTYWAHPRYVVSIPFE